MSSMCPQTGLARLPRFLAMWLVCGVFRKIGRPCAVPTASDGARHAHDTAYRLPRTVLAVRSVFRTI